MITKERFEELIKEGAVIYDIFRGDIYPVNLLSLIKYGDIGFEYHNDYYHCDICRTLSDFYATREEAEWEQEFGSIIRTERLELPTWEEVSSDLQDVPAGNYVIKEFDDVSLEYIKYRNGNYAVIGVYKYDDRLELEATKENYTLACRKAKELFLGETK